MRTFIKAAALVAVITLVPVASFAQAPTTPAPVKKTAPVVQTTTPPVTPKSVASHSTTGTVKSVSDTSLVITKAGKDLTFTVSATTDKKGTIETGSKVSVHYTLDGKTMVATAIAVRPAKAAKKGKK